jgi:hypothetical protein
VNQPVVCAAEQREPVKCHEDCWAPRLAPSDGNRDEPFGKHDARRHVNDAAVKKCLWCGRQNSETESCCLECGTPWDSTSALDKPTTSPTFTTDLPESDRSYRMDYEPFKWIALGFLYSVGHVCFLVARIVSRRRKGLQNPKN